MAESKLKIDIRRGAILKELHRSGRVRTNDLVETFSATPVTIRNDLATLERALRVVSFSLSDASDERTAAVI